MNMFDELHDPDPPAATARHFAEVATRARRIRMRRWATATTSVVAVLAVGVGVGAILTGGGSETIRTEEPPTAPPPPPTSTEPPATAPPTDPPITDAPGATAPAGPASTPVAPPATAPGGPTVTGPSDTAPGSPSIPLGALDESGNAVIIDEDGAPSVVWERMEPPDEGGGSSPEFVLPAADGPLVGFCCEPASGDVYRIDPNVADGRTPVAVGVSPAVSVSGRLATWHHVIDPPELGIVDPGSGAPTLIQMEGVPMAAVSDLMWIADERVAVLAGDPSGGLGEAGPVWPADNVELLLVDVASEAIVDRVELDGAASFAGTGDDGEILVLEPATADISGYDPDTLEPLEPSVAISDVAVSAWYAGGVMSWIDADGVLTRGDDVIDGRYRWVRG